MRSCYGAICVSVCVCSCARAQTSPPPASEMQRAIDEFKTPDRRSRTARATVRRTAAPPQQPAARLARPSLRKLPQRFPGRRAARDHASTAATKVCCGAISTASTSADRSSFPASTHGKSNTYFSLSYEGVHERISRTSLRTIPTTGGAQRRFLARRGSSRQSAAHLRSRNHAAQSGLRSVAAGFARESAISCAIRFPAT